MQQAYCERNKTVTLKMVWIMMVWCTWQNSNHYKMYNFTIVFLFKSRWKFDGLYMFVYMWNNSCTIECIVTNEESNVNAPYKWLPSLIHVFIEWCY